MNEDQIGLDPLIGRPRIVEEVLVEIRQYILVDDGLDGLAREERVKSSIKELEGDYFGQKSMLRLEPPPLVSQNVDKGKGLVFSFEEQSMQRLVDQGLKNDQKLLSATIMSRIAMGKGPSQNYTQSKKVAGNFLVDSSGIQACSTVNRFGSSDANLPGQS